MAKPCRRSEEAQLFRAVADQHVLGLLIMIKHHLVRFAANARLLVTTERGVCRIEVVAVGPDAAGLDFTAEAIGLRAVTRPNARTEAV